MGMPFIGMNEHWSELRKNVQAVFHKIFMNQYYKNFHAACEAHIKDLSGKTNVREFLNKLTYHSASLGLFGSVVEADVPLAGQEGTFPFKKAQHQVIKDWAQQTQKKGFSLDMDDIAVKNLAESHTTIATAVTGLAVARLGQLDEGAEA